MNRHAQHPRKQQRTAQRAGPVKSLQFVASNGDGSLPLPTNPYGRGARPPQGRLQFAPAVQSDNLGVNVIASPVEGLSRGGSTALPLQRGDFSDSSPAQQQEWDQQGSGGGRSGDIRAGLSPGLGIQARHQPMPLPQHACASPNGEAWVTGRPPNAHASNGLGGSIHGGGSNNGGSGGGSQGAAAGTHRSHYGDAGQEAGWQQQQQQQ
ncbi:unnamed protein product, partial [Phaeothamnion confervicola]